MAQENSRTLAQWLDYQQSIHARGIDLGLQRVADVWQRLGAPSIAPLTISVGGTNGKGSTVAFLDAMLSAQNLRVGCYTSPHLLRYNERIRVAGVDVSDAALVDAFERVELARGTTTLTYFEFGTLAAFWIFAHSRLDVALLEVGLGGRLDAVNIIDADAAIVTTVDLDHQDYLGNDREQIGREKGGIFRADRPAIIGELTPPSTLLRAAQERHAQLIRRDIDYRFAVSMDHWTWQMGDVELHLPLPQLSAPSQPANAASAIAALYALRERVPWRPDSIAAGISGAHIAARLQRFAGATEWVVDVAHNPQAARELASWLRSQPAAGRTLAVFSALGDKDMAGVVEPLTGLIDEWHLAALDHETPRGRTSENLGSDWPSAIAAQVHANCRLALTAACASANSGDRIIAFGSFFVAAAALAWVAERGLTDS